MQGRRASTSKSRGYTLIEVMVVFGILVAGAAIMIPALGKARQSFDLSNCQNNARFLTQVTISHSAGNGNVLVSDLRKPALATGPGSSRDYTWVNNVPRTYAERELSWFGQLEAGHIGGNLDMVDCPVVNDHRKVGASMAYRPPWVWPTDYVINGLAVNMSPDLAEQPSRDVLFSEPNMPRGAATVIAHCYAFFDWGTNDMLEQTIAGTLSFGFMDGHAARVVVPRGSFAYLQEFPGLALSAGNPAADASAVFSSAFYLNSRQVNSKRKAILHPPNNLTEPVRLSW